MRVNLRAIAEESGCSIASVSRALSGKGRLAPATRERILAIAAKHKYRPNLLVSGLQTGRTRTVGLLGVEESFIRGIHDALLAADHVPIALWPSRAKDAEDAEAKHLSELDHIHRLVDRRVDGLILCPIYEHGGKGYWKEALEYGLPIVAIDREMTDIEVDFAGMDDETGGRLAAEHLLGLGHRRVAHIAGPGFSSPAVGRRRGFEDAIGKVEGVVYTCVVDKSFGSSMAPAAELLGAETRPTAVFCANDSQAARLLLVAQQLGLRVPQDISVVGFADAPFAKLLAPPLTTVRQDFHAIGHAAATLILDRLDGRLSGAPRKVRLAPELVIRQSTDRPNKGGAA